MAQLLPFNDSASVLLVNRQILLLDVANATCLQVIDLPAVRQPAAPAAQDGATADDAAEPEAEPDTTEPEPVASDAAANESKTLGAASNRILHSAISANGELLALATADEKHLHLFRLNKDYAAEASGAPFATLLSSRSLSRTSNAVRFASDSRQLLVADKTGDCFAYACDVAATGNADQPGQCVLSHLSMVLGILQTPDGRHVLSCDRDEKIRCTNWPRSTVIESYMLGHSEYVAGVELLLLAAKDGAAEAVEQSLAASVSGDRTLRVWDYLSGRQLAQFELPAPALRMAVHAAANGRWLVAVSLHEHTSDLVVLELQQQAAATFTGTAVAEFQFDGVVHVQSVHFERDGSILVAAITRSDESAVFRLVAEAKEEAEEKTEPESSSSSWSYRLDTLDALNTVIAERAADLLVPFNAEEIGLLFKKKFHNIDDYQERKKRRIEDKNSKQQQRQEKHANGGGRGGKRAKSATAVDGDVGAD